ncbi:class I SAM-dependent methyltransferase [Nocardia transvalensis]|uniref:class I SAM-dependent methyltransferase n=1 Tax=Nocardia transvalensis TaxID=37333 RepID=UPI00189478AF|nr:class I SAM-dependent methyltransferase [Nocardia transvalensis]MBF6330809.1 class I SAM-dependent methyltransferase [Nocardia transvalensis]
MAHSATHDHIDWAARLAALRCSDELAAPARAQVARRLAERLSGPATVIDVGPGAGGMSAALARELRAREGGRLVLVEAVPELLDAATAAAAADDAGAPVEVVPVLSDAAAEDLPARVPPADLVWAGRVVHHLPDQQRGIDGLVRLLRDRGWLAVEEGGLETRCLPWDLGIGAPGLVDRLTAAQRAWFADMRAGMEGAVRLPIGWNRALLDAGLAEVGSFGYLIDAPAPPTDRVREFVLEWLSHLAEHAETRLDAADHDALRRLLDPTDTAYVGNRDDIFVLAAPTVYVGRKG